MSRRRWAAAVALVAAFLVNLALLVHDALPGLR